MTAPTFSAGALRLEELLQQLLDRAGELLGAQRRLRGLLDAVVALTADLSLDATLRRVVDSARELADAEYGALGVLGQDRFLDQFVVSGIDETMVAAIGNRRAATAFWACWSTTRSRCGWTTSRPTPARSGSPSTIRG